VWIATGAPVPEGADCIAPIEEVEEDGDTIRVLKEFEPDRSCGPSARTCADERSS